MDPVCLGRIGRPSGLKGEVRFYPFGETLSSLSPPLNVWIKRGKCDPKPAKITGIKVLPKYLRIKLNGSDSRDKASELTNSELYIDEGELPELGNDEYYLYELRDMEVYTLGEGRSLGRVIRAEKYPSVDSIDVKSPDNELYTIPLSDNILISVDRDKRRIVVDEESLGEIL